jgi:hypothetical protein
MCPKRRCQISNNEKLTLLEVNAEFLGTRTKYRSPTRSPINFTSPSAANTIVWFFLNKISHPLSAILLMDNKFVRKSGTCNVLSVLHSDSLNLLSKMFVLTEIICGGHCC